MKTFFLPSFGILLTLLSYFLGVKIYKESKLPIFNPIIIALTLIISILVFFNIPLEYYSKGGDTISLFLSSATITLAVPLHKKIHLLKKYFIPILGGTTIGILTSIFTCYFMGILLKVDIRIIKSSFPKSITTPIAMALSENVGGIISITIAMVIVTGIIGAIMAPFICKIFQIENKVAKGIAIGTASHAVGTSRAIEMGETEGAMSGLAIGIAGTLTVFILPIVTVFLF